MILTTYRAKIPVYFVFFFLTITINTINPADFFGAKLLYNPELVYVYVIE